MDGPRLTEERLRNHLDSNQVMRERMCLALLPLLGPYTREQPRRPKGGPDDGRDIEAIYQGEIPVWGAVGFRNGGGADDSARNWAKKKFQTDLERALQENPSLVGFIFFTNVDLTPTRTETLIRYAQKKNVKIVDIFDMEKLRHVLDSPEGLIARLQYLKIPMSNTERASLVAKFGTQLQNAVTARFDRVERTLAQMERFLDLQKPISRLDIYIELIQPTTSAVIGDEATLLLIDGLYNNPDILSCLCVNHIGHKNSNNALVTKTYIWDEDEPAKAASLLPSMSPSPNLMTSYSELSLTIGGQRVSIADRTILRFEAFCTDGFRDKIRRVTVDANGYELFCCSADKQDEATELKWAEGLPYNAAAHKWVGLVKQKQRNLLFNPLERSRPFLPLHED